MNALGLEEYHRFMTPRMRPLVEGARRDAVERAFHSGSRYPRSRPGGPSVPAASDPGCDDSRSGGPSRSGGHWPRPRGERTRPQPARRVPHHRAGPHDRPSGNRCQDLLSGGGRRRLRRETPAGRTCSPGLMNCSSSCRDRGPTVPSASTLARCRAPTSCTLSKRKSSRTARRRARTRQRYICQGFVNVDSGLL